MPSEELLNLKVEISGVTLAAALHDFAAIDGDLEGLVYGCSYMRKVRVSEDEDPHKMQEVPVIDIHYFDVFGGCFSLCNLDGSPSSSVQNLSEDRPEVKPIGWFKFRRNSGRIMSVRESAAHTKLAQNIGTRYGLKGFLFFLFTASENEERHHEMNYLVFRTERKRYGDFLNVPVEVLNLSAIAHEAYRSLRPASSYSHHFDTVCKKVEPCFDKRDRSVTKEVLQFERAFEETYNELKYLCAELAASELEIESERIAISRLRRTSFPGDSTTNLIQF
eukprot:Nk52_evm8s1224 gene=Nk52_evmTU8s1224